MNPLFQARHYKFLASLLREEYKAAGSPEQQQAVQRLVERLMRNLAVDNPNFRKGRFMRAVFAPEEPVAKDRDDDQWWTGSRPRASRGCR